MSTSPDQIPKQGWFHYMFGTPLLPFIRGNSGAYHKLNQELTQIEKNRTEQLRLLPELEAQRQELSQAEIILKASLAQNKDDIAVAQQLKRQAEQHLNDVEFNSPLSTQPRVPTPGRLLDIAIGRIPYVGTIYTGYQLEMYRRDRKEAIRIRDIETDAVRDIEEFGLGVQERLTQNLDASRKAAQELEAQRKLIEGLALLQQAILEKRNNL
jgi:hypothetical protein